MRSMQSVINYRKKKNSTKVKKEFWEGNVPNTHWIHFDLAFTCNIHRWMLWRNFCRYKNSEWTKRNKLNGTKEWLEFLKEFKAKKVRMNTISRQNETVFCTKWHGFYSFQIDIWYARYNTSWIFMESLA